MSFGRIEGLNYQRYTDKHTGGPLWLLGIPQEDLFARQRWLDAQLREIDPADHGSFQEHYGTAPRVHDPEFTILPGPEPMRAAEFEQLQLRYLNLSGPTWGCASFVLGPLGGLLEVLELVQANPDAFAADYEVGSGEPMVSSLLHLGGGLSVRAFPGGGFGVFGTAEAYCVELESVEAVLEFLARPSQT